MKLLSLAARLGSGGMVLAALVGAPVAAFLGPSLAMGFVIWSGQTTEPVQPDLSYPWLALLALLAVWGWSVQRRPEAWWTHALVQVSAAAAALLPWIHLWRLSGRALE